MQNLWPTHLAGSSTHSWGLSNGFESSYVVSILGSTLLILYWDNKDYILILIIAAKFGISSAFNMSFIASIELIPALVAASVFWVLQCCGKDCYHGVFGSR